MTVSETSIDHVLTRREKEILNFLAEGKTSRQIAGNLNLSVFTVNNHRKHICKKLGVHSTAELIALAVHEAFKS